MKPLSIRLASFWLPGVSLLVAVPIILAKSPPLIVVEDRGGTSALPYYEALKPRSRANGPVPRIELPRVPSHAFDEGSLLPVRSARLSPGDVPRRVIQAPGFQPLFLIGDDDRSRAWLRLRVSALRELGAVGLVVQVESPQALASLRALAPGVVLAPVSGDDLAQRLGLHHYPALVTATGIEQ